MNKAELIESLAARLGDKKVAAHALDGFIDIIERAVAKGEKVAITGFGTFEKVDRAARVARNPRTGEKVKLKKTAVPKFRPGTELKGVAAGTIKKGREPKHEPLLPSGITRIVATAMADSAASSPAPAAKKTAPRKTAAKVTASAKKTTTAPAAKKITTPKASPTRKTTTKAPAAKSTATKTAKAVPAKTAAKKAPAAKVTASKSAPAKTAAKKAPAAKKTTTPKASPARKTTSKATTAKKTTARKTAKATSSK